MTIGEMSVATGLPESTLRYYEKRNLIKVARDNHKRRVYNDNDVEWIKFIRRLKETGMKLNDIQHYSALRYQGNETMPERLEILERHREYVQGQVDLWHTYLKNLEEKIGFYRDSIAVGLG